MQQIIQDLRTGNLSVASVPPPIVQRGQVLIQNTYSIISAGTEKMVIDLANKSLLGMARERPDRVRQVLEKVRTQGVTTTWAQVKQKLNEPIALGYSSSGVVVGCGAGVEQFKPGDHVASNGHHAGLVSVPHHLCARAPEGVSLEQAAFTVLGAIALQGVRLTRTGLGDMVFVIGLGLVGQIAVRLLTLQGCRVIGMDLDEDKCRLAQQMGAQIASPRLDAHEVQMLSRDIGADAVLITAATKSDSPVHLAAEAVRSKGRVVAVGAVGLNLPRQPFYLKEAEFVISCSYGPGRYDPEYEDRGHDYPVGYVRWTEQRNMQAVLDLMATGQLDLSPLITHRFDIGRAEEAYRIIHESREPYLGMVLKYPEASPSTTGQGLVLKAASAADGKIGIGCLGAGGFARAVLLPAIRKVKGLQLRAVCSATGLSAAVAGEQFGFETAAADEDGLLADPRIQAVFAITRHDQHARQVLAALHAGKHVFVEKPLALTTEELKEIESTLWELPRPRPLVMVGFNRRFSPAAVAVREFFSNVRAPLTVSIRFNAGALPREHWTQDETVGGGRIIGEACHAIDLATYLTGASPVRVFAESIGGPDAPEITDDQCFITLRHANGAISNIAYLAGGDRAMPKERVEVLGGGQFAVIDDFCTLTLAAGGKVSRKRQRQDKGHQAEVEAFAHAVIQGGAAPIPWEELRAVSLASLLAVQSLREGVPLELGSITACQAAA